VTKPWQRPALSALLAKPIGNCYVFLRELAMSDLAAVEIERDVIDAAARRFRESDGPGPSPHIVLCAATGRQGATKFAIVFYTTTQIEYQGARRPRQYLFINESRAKALHQRKGFHVDASRVAR
jgi:hypothetical protein